MGDVAVIDGSSGDVLFASMLPSASRQSRSFGDSDNDSSTGECLLPRSAAYDAKRKSLFVGCYGIDDLVEYDALAASPVRAVKRRWDVAAGPGGIVTFDGAKDRAVVWSQFERACSTW